VAGTIKKYGNIAVWDVTLTVPTALTTISATSDMAFGGEIVKIEIDPGAAMATSATLVAYDADTGMTAPESFLSLTFPASEVERTIYPALVTLLNTGEAAVTARTVPYIICGRITATLASAVAADSTRVRVYVKRV
jgi:hypothetical protein